MTGVEHTSPVGALESWDWDFIKQLAWVHSSYDIVS